MSEGGHSPNDRLNSKSIQPKESSEVNDQIDPIKTRKPQREPDATYKKKRKLLSFEDEQEEQPVDTVPKIKKNVNIKSDQTDKSHQNIENLEEKLKEEFFRESERLREELIELEYSYWDGPNVVKKIRRKKRTTVKQFLEVCRLQLIQNFQNIAEVEAKDLLFVIKDFIAPHDITLGDVQLLKLKTAKKDLLLNLRNVKFKKDGKDLTLSVNLDGPVRIVQRTRYEKNKANYPFCNWHTLNLREK